MRGERGFTLIEMMIVVSIISILLAIAVPNLLRNRIQANEAAAIENLRVIGSAQVTYHGSHNTFATFAELIDTGAGAPFLDEGWTEGSTRSGYVYTMPSADAVAFVSFADPETPGASGNRYFRIDGSGIVRYSNTGQPDENGTPINTVAP